MITDLEHSTNLNTFRSVIEIYIMSSSSADELPDIPGTKYPWMEDVVLPSSRSPRKQPKRPRISAVEKERNLLKGPKKKTSIRMEISSDDDDFADPQPGTSTAKPAAKKKPMTNAEKCAKRRAKMTMEQKEAVKKADVARKAATKANETAEEQRQRKHLDAKRHAAARANETPEEHQQRNKANAQQTAAARANETKEEHLQRNQ